MFDCFFFGFGHISLFKIKHPRKALRMSALCSIVIELKGYCIKRKRCVNDLAPLHSFECEGLGLGLELRARQKLPLARCYWPSAVL